MRAVGCRRRQAAAAAAAAPSFRQRAPVRRLCSPWCRGARAAACWRPAAPGRGASRAESPARRLAVDMEAAQLVVKAELLWCLLPTSLCPTANPLRSGSMQTAASPKQHTSQHAHVVDGYCGQRKPLQFSGCMLLLLPTSPRAPPPPTHNVSACLTRLAVLRQNQCLKGAESK